MLNYYFKDTIESFQLKSNEEIIGLITISNQFDSTITQNKSWEQQILILKDALEGYNGTIFFEFSIPRMGKRIDSLIIIDNVVFNLEFKVGENKFFLSHIEQVWDYALDLKNFHKPSHHIVLAPIKTSNHKYHCFIFWQNNIQSAGKFFIVQSISETICKQKLLYQHLRLCVTTFDLTHVLTSCFLYHAHLSL